MAVPRRMPSVQTQVRRLVGFAVPDDEWVQSAACAQTDPALFFAKDLTKAKLVCRGCEVRQECLEDALTFESQERLEDQTLIHPVGCRGGLSGKERKALMAGPKRDRRAERRAAALADLRNGMSSREVAVKYEVAINTVYDWSTEARRQAREGHPQDESGAA